MAGDRSDGSRGTVSTHHGGVGDELQKWRTTPSNGGRTTGNRAAGEGQRPQ